MGEASPHPVVAIVQARMGSSRLPGKVLREAASQPLIAHLLERLAATSTLDAVVVATTDQPGDDALAAWCQQHGVAVVRGSENDVLARFALAAEQSAAATVVRVTADCPLMDPAEVDRVVSAFVAQWPQLDYVANQGPGRRLGPLGLAVEVFSRASLERAALEARAPYQREHVTPYLYDDATRFRTLLSDPPEDHADLRLTVDTPEDLAVVSPVLEHVAQWPGDFSLARAVAFLRAHPAIAALNQGTAQKSFREAAGTVLLLRADASAEMGTGHVMRLLGLAQAWKRRGGRAVLAAHVLPEALAQRWRDAGLGVELLPADVEPGDERDVRATAWLAGQLGATLVLVDGYQFSAGFLADLGKAGLRVAYIDDFGAADLPVDVSLMPNAGAEAPAGHLAAQVLAGTTYTPVRQEFRDAARPQRSFDHTPLRLLLTFGGSDPARMSLRALRAALAARAKQPLDITLLLGPARAETDSAEELAAESGVRVLRDVRDMPGLLAGIDLALSAAGTTCWELATLGVPMLLVPVANNQTTVVHGITSAGAGLALQPAWQLSDAHLHEAVLGFVSAGAATLGAMSAAGMRLVDGRGADRIADALAEVAARTPGGSR